MTRHHDFTAQGKPRFASDAQRRLIYGPLRPMQPDGPLTYLRKLWRATPMFQRWICAYIVVGTVATISWSLAISEPPAPRLAANAPADAVASHLSAVEAGAATGEGR